MADSTYIIDIAANMPDGAATGAELDALVDKLMGASKRSDEFQAAIKRLSADLEAAKSASADAAAALAVGNDRYRELEREAVRAAKAVERANSRGRVSDALVQQALDARNALDAYTGELKKLEDAAAGAKGEQDRLVKSLANVNKLGGAADARAQLMNQRFEKLGAVVGRLPGPLGRVGSELINSAKGAHGLSMAFSGAQVAALAAAAAVVVVVAAVVALTVATVAGAVAFTQYAVAQADAARTAELAREAFAALSPETAAAASAFDDVALATGLADNELASLAKQLRAAEVSAADMPEALMAAALAERALGSGGAGEFIAEIKDGTKSVREFARESEAAFGGIVAEQIRGIDAQLKRASKSWTQLFAGINLDPFLDALSVLTGMFEKGHPLAEAFGLAVEGAINPIGPLALRAAYAIEAFVLEFAIQLTKMYLFIKPALGWLAELFGFGSDGSADFLIEILATAGKVAAVLAVVLGGALATALAAVAALIAPMVAGTVLMTMAIGAVIDAVNWLVTSLADLGGQIVEWATTVGVDLMMGLVSGITSAVGTVVNTVSNAVGSAIDAAKDVLGISSPSKVFAEIGGYTAEGFSAGVEEGTPDAQGSMTALVAPEAAAAQAPAAAQAAGSASTGGGGASVNLAGATFTFHGVKDAENARALFEEMFTKVLQGDADSLAGATT